MKLDEIVETTLVKFLCVGHSGAGKTGSLASLVPDYDLRIINFDGSNINVLAQFIKRNCPDRLSSIEVINCRDTMKVGPRGPIVKGTPNAMKTCLEALTKWPEDDSIPAEWGQDKILVIDSLSMMGRAAYNWANFNDPLVKDKRQIFFSGQNMVENTMSWLTNEEFATNVIVLTHIELTETSEGTKGFPRALGQALGPKLPMYFPTLVLLQSSGVGDSVKRQFHTIPTATIDLKTAAPFKINKTLPIEDGMAQLFHHLKEE